MKANNILETIGNTPHVKVNRLFRSDIEVWIKLESFNPGGSIKDRIGFGNDRSCRSRRNIESRNCHC
jgi:cysteine synthase A